MASLQSREENDVLIVAVEASTTLDETEIQRLADQLNEFADQASAKKLLLNISQASYMSSALIGNFVTLSKRCRQDEIDLKICCVTPEISSLFAIMKLDTMFDIRDTEEEALAAFA